MAPNRIDLPGTAEEAWESWLELRHLPAVSPQAWRSVVVVAAHPDDEVLGVGGTMALLAAGGTRLRLIAVTDGEASHPDADPEAIGRTRTAESAAALAALGVPDIEVVRLRFPDTGLAAREDELAARLRELCAGFEVCLAPWEADAHADHEAAGRAARRAARRDRPGGAELPDLDVALGQARRPAGALAAGLPGAAGAGGRGQQAIGHRGVHQPAHRPCGGRAGASARDRGSLHPAAGGVAALTAPVTLPAGYFDAMYQAAVDPWGFEERWYEQRKYAISLAQLPAARYRRAFEPGCSVGVLTQMLARRCDTLLACDLAGPRSAPPPGAPRTCRMSGSSSVISPGSGRPAASTSSCFPRSCTTSGTTTSSRS